MGQKQRECRTLTGCFDLKQAVGAHPRVIQSGLNQAVQPLKQNKTTVARRTLTGCLDSNRRSEHTGQLPDRLCSTAGRQGGREGAENHGCKSSMYGMPRMLGTKHAAEHTHHPCQPASRQRNVTLAQRHPPQRCLLNSSRLMQALQDMQWKESTPNPRPCRGVIGWAPEGMCKHDGVCVAGHAVERIHSQPAALHASYGGMQRQSESRMCASGGSRKRHRRVWQACLSAPVLGAAGQHESCQRWPLLGRGHCTQRSSHFYRTWRQKLQKGQW